ncbi:MAG: FkbM family methyltransferase [Saprospiraceae bacterium]|nr:FkbM family methyltransferase [Saprospiraceae bacterium]
MFQTIKKIVKKLPFAFTQNQKYDRQTYKILKKVLRKNSNCIDVGCHKGEVLDLMLSFAPDGKHFGFEPIPDLAAALNNKYKNSSCSILPVALSNIKEKTSFNYVISNPSYSGLLKRTYDRKHETDTLIEVQTDLLDNILPSDYHVDLIKIDVEGGELLVLQGARKTLLKYKPFVIFEHGLGASDIYESFPEKVYILFDEMGMQINILRNFLYGKKPLTKAEFEMQFYKKQNYYFIAYPK